MHFQAIIQKNFQALKQSVELNPSGLLEKNEHGFDALEMCQLLNFTQGEQLLHRSHPRIKAYDKQTKRYVRLSPHEFEKQFHIHYFSTLKFADYSSFVETLHNFPLCYPFLLEKIPQFNQRIHVDTHPAVGIKWINSDIGYGAFTTQHLSSGTIIGEYTGYVRRLYRSHPNTNPYCFHYPSRFFSLRYFVIDALRGGNALRFVNHSDRPNLTPAWVFDRQLLHLIFLTIRAVEPNSQLTIDYGQDFWKSRQKITRI